MLERIRLLNEGLADRYHIERELGVGGMATVYLATDLKHDRPVAVKVFHPEVASSIGSERFLREIRITARLNHPHILTLIDSGQVGESLYYVLPFVEGESLREKIERDGRLEVEEALSLMDQICSAIQYAHEQEILHRDIKPENVLLHRGEAMVSDFGIAVGLAAASDERLTGAGMSLGSPCYMSPEQVEASGELDERSDLFAVGCVAYEMLAGEPPFTGRSTQEILTKILTTEPRPLTASRSEVPEEISVAIMGALRRDPTDRPEDVGAFRSSLRKRPVKTSLGGRNQGWIFVGGLALAGIALWQAFTGESGAAVDSALARIDMMASEADFVGAWQLTREIAAELPDTTLARVWGNVARNERIASVPAGATISWRPFGESTAPWQPLGTTPFEEWLPQSLIALRLELEGHETRFVGAHQWQQDVTWKLQPEASELRDVVHVRGGDLDLGRAAIHLFEATEEHVGEFLIDRFEVTNTEYAAFIEDGGYENPGFWEHSVEKDGVLITWAESMELFRDKTGQPGPSQWELGTYPAETGDHPVTGVSWYEAAAYAKWAGRQLPTVYHWFLAADVNYGSQLLPNSNINGTGLAPVGEFPGFTPSGVFDMAGNAREWVFNGDGSLRYTVGGGWDDAYHFFGGTQAQPPIDRSRTNGFRLITDLGEPDRYDVLGREIERRIRDFASETPVSEDVFEFFLSTYAYDDSPLNDEIERTDAVDGGVRERITFDAAYGDERMILYLFLPEDREPPYQTVMYMPGAGALTGGDVDGWSSRTDHPVFLMRSGRAVAFPVYKSVWDREDDFFYQLQDPSNDHRDHVIMWRQDIGRSLDYLETRSDIDSDLLSFMGYSWGGRTGVIMMAVEPRFKAGVLYVAGLSVRPTQAVVEPLNFAPRVKIPVLMLNGQFDHIYPLESQARPLYRLLGSEQKELFVAPGGHSVPFVDLVRETNTWLDEHVGPVR